MKQLELIQEHFPDEVRAVVLEVAHVDIESYIKENDIPVDTGRLRASFHVKYLKKPNAERLKRGSVLRSFKESQLRFQYDAQELDRVVNKVKQYRSTSFDGSLSANPTMDTVIVGSNVEYAKKMNRLGGGGEGSGRTVDGNKYPKGYGKNFFDNAVNNGQIALIREMRNLVNRINKFAERMKRESDRERD